MKIKKNLASISITTVLISLIIIILYITNIGTDKLSMRIVRFGLTIVLSYYLYKENQWARFIFTILFLTTGLVGILNMPKIGFSLNTIPLGLVSLFYTISGIYIGFIRKRNS